MSATRGTRAHPFLGDGDVANAEGEHQKTEKSRSCPHCRSVGHGSPRTFSHASSSTPAATKRVPTRKIGRKRFARPTFSAKYVVPQTM